MNEYVKRAEELKSESRGFAEDGRRCTGCGELKDEECFYLQTNGYYASKCVECTLKVQKKANLGKLLEKHDLTLDDYEECLENQQGKCACCGEYETAVGKYSDVKRLAVDIGENGINLICDKCSKVVRKIRKFENKECLVKYLAKS